MSEGSLARFIYLDEAGTSADEPVTVVAGILVHPDSQWRSAWDYLEKLRQEVPEEIRDGYIFHAKDIFHGGKVFTRKKWGRDVRWPILEKLLAGPRLCGLPIVFAYARAIGLDPKMDLFFRHVIAFTECLKAANAGMKTLCPNELATLVAEDHRDMRQFLSRIPDLLRSANAPEFLTGPHAFDAIVDSVHFTEKKSAPLLQMADAVAFAVRHYWSGHPQGAWAMQNFTDFADLAAHFDSSPDVPAASHTLYWPAKKPPTSPMSSASLEERCG